MKEFEASGYWHLPEEPSNQVVGTLYYSPKEGARLSLTGSFAGESGIVESRSYPLVYGIVTDTPFGKKLTLVDCLQTRRCMSVPGFATEELRTSRAYAGEHLLKESDLSFTGARVRFSQLLNWVGATGIKSEMVSEGGKVVGVDISYRRGKEFTIPVQDVELKIGPTFRVDQARLGGISLREEEWIAINGIKGLSADEISKTYVRPLQNLLSLAADTPNAIDDFIAVNADLINPGTEEPAPVHVLWQPVFVVEEPVPWRMPEEMLFTFADVEDFLPDLLDRWFRLRSDADPFSQVYFALQEAPPRYIDARFLSLLQAMALYFCGTADVGGRYRDLTKHVGAAMANLVSDEDRPWLHAIVPNEKDVSFPRSLFNALEKNADIMRPLVSNDIRAFAGRVMDTRNYLLHRDPALQGRAAGGAELLWMIKKLMVLINACLLDEIGFRRDKLIALFNRNRNYLHLKTV